MTQILYFANITLKIISNCCLTAFLHEVMVSYASSIIRIRLKIAPSFENNENFCLVSIICKSSFLSGQYIGSSSVSIASSLSSKLKVQSCKLYNNKYMIASTQITNTEIFAFRAVLVFKLLSRKVCL